MKRLHDIQAEAEHSSGSFLTVEMVKQIQPPVEMVELVSENGPQFPNPNDSFSPKYDAVKIDYLLRNGIHVPTDWYRINKTDSEKPSDRYEASPLAHAEIVSCTIVLGRLKDLFALLGQDLSDEELQVELEYHAGKILSHRVNVEGDREIDVTGVFRNREERMKSQAIPCNPKAQLSLEELAIVRDVILNSYKKSDN